MLSRPRVCWAADIAKVPLMTARRPAVRRAILVGCWHGRRALDDRSV